MSIASDYELCVEYAARTIGATEDEIRGRCRAARNVTARRLVAMILRRRGYSLPAIGAVFGVRHTTVMRLIVRDRYTTRRQRLQMEFCEPEVDWAMERIEFATEVTERTIREPAEPSGPPIRSNLGDDFVAGALEVLNSAGKEAKARVWDAISDAVLARRAA